MSLRHAVTLGPCPTHPGTTLVGDVWTHLCRDALAEVFLQMLWDAMVKVQGIARLLLTNNHAVNPIWSLYVTEDVFLRERN